ncbi:MAG: hypothetical protein ACI8YQ_002123 [Polaribacter sp.]|jgi:hypothetical protein
MKNPIITLVFTLLTIFAHAQEKAPERDILTITQFASGELNGIKNTKNGIRSTGIQKTAEFVRYDMKVPITELSSFLAFSIVWEAQNWNSENNQLWVRFKGGNTNLNWQQIKIDVHSDKNDLRHISELTFVDNDVDKLDIKIVFEEGSQALVQKLDLHFYNPGSLENKLGSETKQANNRAVCTCPQPDFEDRDDWCPAGNCPEIANPTITDVTHLIVHHSAGVNSSSDWAGVVRSIWDFHVNVNGWDDIGYNYLVDPSGILYEGRGNNIRGAHFCGNNGGTMGVCVMGDFTNISPTDNAKSMLKDLLAWKICDIDADPLEMALHASSGLNLSRISGHQDGCATACPGASFYPQFSAIRSEVNTQINNDCELEELAAPTNLTAESVSQTAVELNWEDNSNNETAFIIERSIWTNTSYTEVGNVAANVNIFTDGNLQANTAYFYQVKATNAPDESAYSNQVGVATVLTSTKNVGDLAIEVFPNPVEDWLTIVLPKNSGEKILVSIFEMGSSKMVKQFKTTSNDGIIKQDVSDLAKGVYLLQVNDGQKNAYAKLVKR